MSSRVFEPLAEGHPALAECCPSCGKRFEVGDRTVIKPYPRENQDTDTQARMAEGRPYNARSYLLHSTCVGPARQV